MKSGFEGHGWRRGALALAVAAAVGPAAAQAQPVAAVKEEWSYRIVAGDTLIGVATNYLRRTGDWRGLQRLNGIADPLHLVPGSNLRIPVAWLRSSATVATAVFVRGEVQLQREGSTAPAPLMPDDTLQAGDTVLTGPAALTTVRFADGARLLVRPDSRVKIEHLLVYGRGELPDTRLRLERGSTDSKVVPNPAAPGYEIRTPAANLGVRGTEFRAHVEPDGSAARVEVLEGRVGAAAGRRRTLVDAGFGALARAGGRLSAAQPLIAAPGLAGVPRLLERLPLRFGWQPLAGAVGYRAEVLAGDAADRLLLDGRFAEPAARWPDLPDGSYQLRVRGIDAQGLEGRDAGLRFVLNARPEPPFTLQPPSGGKVYGERVEFAWARSAAAAGYRLQVAAAADFSSLLLDQAGIAEPQFSLALPPGDYHWRAATIGPGDDPGPFGDAQRFTLRAVPPDPAIEKPEKAPDGLLFRWRAPEPGQSVQFQVASDAQFQQLLLDQRSGEAQALLPAPRPGRYYLRARSIDADGYAGPYGAVQQVEVPASPWWLLIPIGAFLLLL